MLIAYKTEINPTIEQQNKINQTLGVARWVSNNYISHNQEAYKKDGSFISGMEFSKWLNNTFIPNNPEYLWVKDVYAKSTKQAIMNTEKAFKRFFNGTSKFPKFKKKSNQASKMYFVRNGSSQPILHERHRIKIPTLGWVKLKEKGYIPTSQEIISGTISRNSDRYYVSVLIEQANSTAVLNENPTEGVGIDLGLKDFAICSNGTTYKNINKTSRVKNLERKLKREQRMLSRKYEAEKTRIQNNEIKKGESTRKNIQKQVLKVQKLHQTLSNIRKDYHNKIVSEIVKTKPSHITVENLNVKGMMQNRHLSKAISKQGFYTFNEKLRIKSAQHGIEYRIVGRFYPSSKLCHECGQIKRDLTLSDRVYKCECGYTKDRDVNASLNLRDALTYTIAY